MFLVVRVMDVGYKHYFVPWYSIKTAVIRRFFAFYKMPELTQEGIICLLTPCLELKLSQLQAFPRTQAVLYDCLERNACICSTFSGSSGLLWQVASGLKCVCLPASELKVKKVRGYQCLGFWSSDAIRSAVCYICIVFSINDAEFQVTKRTLNKSFYTSRIAWEKLFARWL